MYVLTRSIYVQKLFLEHFGRRQYMSIILKRNLIKNQKIFDHQNGPE